MRVNRQREDRRSVMQTALVDDELWELIQPLLPRRTRRYTAGRTARRRRARSAARADGRARRSDQRKTSGTLPTPRPVDHNAGATAARATRRWAARCRAGPALVVAPR